MTDREKLIDLLESVEAHQRLYPEQFVDHLIANGVTIQESKIPVVHATPTAYTYEEAIQRLLPPGYAKVVKCDECKFKDQCTRKLTFKSKLSNQIRERIVSIPPTLKYCSYGEEIV